jgi:hypothetical protein
VLFGGVPAPSVVFVSEHELTVMTPLGQTPGVVSITVTNPDGDSDTLPLAYTFTGSGAIRFKDPYPSLDMLTATGQVSSDPSVVAVHGVDRTGAQADGVTKLVFEYAVESAGTVHVVLDDDSNPNNTQPSALSVGSMTALSGGVPQTTVTVSTNAVNGHYLAHAVYTVPQDFIRTSLDNTLSTRPIWVRATFTSSGGTVYPAASSFFNLHRPGVLYFSGMWGSPDTFGWPVMSDPRWITSVEDYAATNASTFAANAETAKAAIRQLRKKTNDAGIAGTRFSVFAHSMGGVLFKIFIGGGSASYTRLDNFFAGDVYELVPVDSPFTGSYLAPFVQALASTPIWGPTFAQKMADLDMPIDKGCMQSLDPQSRDILNIAAATGTFHAMVGWGGKEMLAAGIAILDDKKLKGLENTLKFFDYTMDQYLLQCASGTGHDFIVCTNSQFGGLSGSSATSFHYQNAQERAIHFDSICQESQPSSEAERLLNTPTVDAGTWAMSLPATSQIAPALGEQGGEKTLSGARSAFRAIDLLHSSIVAGACIAMSGGTCVSVAEAAPNLHTSQHVVSGSVVITSPAPGSTVYAGSTLTVSAVGNNGFTITRGLVSSRAFSSEADSGPNFTTQVIVPPSYVGPLTIKLLAKDSANNILEAAPVMVTVVVPGGVSLQGLSADKVSLLWESPTRQLRVYGLYSDGVKRELTDTGGVTYSVVDTGIADISSGGVVTANAVGATLCHVSYENKTLDITLDVSGVRPNITLQKTGSTISWANQGSGITYDVVRGSLGTLRSSVGNFTIAVDSSFNKCQLITTQVVDSANPAAANGFFYLMRTSRERLYDESPFWGTRSQIGLRTAEIETSGLCP